MNYNWSPQKKFSTWRKLWIALAQAEREMGLNITEEQLEEMRKHVDDINFDVAKKIESQIRHGKKKKLIPKISFYIFFFFFFNPFFFFFWTDVMSHISAYGQQCPKAAPIIHLGATSW